ncbi:hypothetical protein ASG22_09235 [Chryseobacterium sp. Leaf405]|uniref:type VI secretion system Vgr family protein n=1 Tax=Chryseobacterium sp. Leaf405 TaxID=1736367 RepID=UPI0006FE7FDC|nr:phage baseplate assembly protein V [Chryseobacterium sp. Leaf405]KQT24188.1 hypothetical protein ASG22_09235 [Chryseobacterium sp. Leaf405]
MEENNVFSGGRLNHPDDLKKHFSGKTYRQFSEEKHSPQVYSFIYIDGKEFKGSYRQFSEEKHSPQVYSFIYIDGKEFKGSCQIEIIQHTGNHDTFTITTPDDNFDSFSGYVMENSKNLSGKNISILFKRYGEDRQTFRGIIGKVENSKNEGGGYGKLIITGFSPSILLESGKDCQSFENKTLEQIIKQITSEYPNEAHIVTEILNTKHNLPYTVQYKETDYEFIKRLAILHGEYFYYNGESLVFGNKVQPIITLEEGSDLIDVQFELKVKPQDFSYISYDSVSGNIISKDSSQVQKQYKENPFQAVQINSSNKIFRKKPQMYFNHTDTESGLNEAVRKEKEKRENLVSAKGKSKDPALKIGGRAKLIDINDKAMETYRIIEIKHYYDGNTYYNEFVGIPDLFTAPYQDNDAVPFGEIQSARVLDNNDPDGMGRVRVQFPWQLAKNEKTPWLRLIQPHSGSGKGFHFIPEISEEVLVGFESNNAEKPFVMGTHYNGKETSGYGTSDNSIKAIHTRSGTKIILNDAEGSVFIEDPSGNTYLMDGQGNINVNAPKNMTFTAGEDINITAGKNMNTNIGNNQTTSVSNNIFVTAGNDIMESAIGDRIETSNNRTEFIQETVLRNSKNSETFAGEINIHSTQENMVMQSAKTIEWNSGEKSNLF